jgi:serine/threonine protein kinase/WD40 repeat protein
MDDSRLDDLLDQYQELIDAGRVPNLAELCRQCPELQDELGRRVVRLHRLGELLGDLPAVPAPVPEPLSLSEDKTWVSGTAARAEPTVVEIPAPPGYEIVEPLGEGGMGVVYKARQVGLNRLVALKVILRGTRARAIDLSRFRDEAQAIAALKHPNIVQIYDVGEYRGQPYFSLEFCAGGTLAKALTGEPQTPESAAAMAEVLARAIQSAHEKGIVHRDLKPANVLLAIEGEGGGGGMSTMVGEAPAEVWRHLALRAPQAAFKITDFGLAKRVDDDSGRTLDGSVVGTPSYMSPEQSRGDTKLIGKCSDVWALGAVLYELLTGRPPFRGSTVLDTLDQVRSRDPVPVRELQPRVPVDLETICLKCLEKDPAKRYASAQVLADDLRRFLDHKPILARPIGQLTRAWRWCRRDPRTAGLVAAIVLLAAIVPALVVAYGLRLSRAEERFEEQQKATAAAIKAERAAQLAAETNRYFAAINQAARLRSQPRPGWRAAAIANALEAAGAPIPARDPVVVRTELATALGAIDLYRRGAVADGQYAGAIAVAPDGRIAVAPQLAQPVAAFGFVSLVDPAAGTTTKLSFAGTLTAAIIDASSAVAFSPDGRWLFLALRSGTVYRWAVDRPPGPTRTAWAAHDGDIAGFAFSPDSQCVYTAGHDGQVKRWPIAGDGRKPPTHWPPTPVKPAGRPRTGLAYWDGPRPGILAFGPAGAVLLDPVTLKEVQPGDDWSPPAIAGGDRQIVAHAPSGTVVVERDRDAEVVYWERGICQSVGRLRDPRLDNGGTHAGRIEGMSLHPSGLLLATVSPDEGQAKLWDLTSGELLLAVPAPGGRAVAFSADGRTLAVGGDHTTVLYEVVGLRERTYAAHRGLPVRAIGRTANGDLATVATIEVPNNPQRARTVVSVWAPDGTLRDTVIHRADGPVVTGHYRIAASPASGRTVFHVGDSALVWLGPGQAGPTSIEAVLKRTAFFDLSLDAAGRAWSLEGRDRLGRRNPGAGGPAAIAASGWAATGARKDLSSVCAGAGVVVVGCENGYVRVVPSDGGLVQSCPCFGYEGPEWLMDRANTVQAVDVRDDSTQAIAGTEDGWMWLIGLPRAEKLGQWPAHNGRVTTVAFGPRGDWLASGGRDRDVRLWRRTENGYEPYMTVTAGRPIRQVVFSADGTDLIVLREGDAAVRVWHLDLLHNRFREASLDP